MSEKRDIGSNFATYRRSPWSWRCRSDFLREGLEPKDGFWRRERKTLRPALIWGLSWVMDPTGPSLPPATRGPQERVRGYLRTGWWIDTHDSGNYLLTVKGRRVRDGRVLFSNDFRLPVQTWVGADLDRLAYVDDNAAEVELWLRKGAPVRELGVEVDLVEAEYRARAITHCGGPAHAGKGSCCLRPHRPEGGDLSRAGAGPGWMADSGRTGPAGALYLHRNGPPPQPEPPLEIPVAPQLFVDDFLIEGQRHLRRVFHPARKLDAQALFRPDRPWEGHYAILREGAALSFNREEQRYELEYISPTRYRMLAVSSDGLRWTKPELGLVEFQGSRANNILEKLPSRGHVGEGEEFGGLWDYRTRGIPDLRTATRVSTPKFPGHGISAGDLPDGPGFRRSGVSHHGASLHEESPAGGDAGQPHRQPGSPCSTTSGPVSWCSISRPHPPAMGRALVRYDNKWAVSRNLGRMTTRDGVNWNRSYIWAPPREHPKHQSYGMQRVKRIGDLYVAFFPLYDCGTQRMSIHLWVSRNGIHWEDLGGDRAWIPSGPDGSFDYGIVYSFSEGPVEGRPVRRLLPRHQHPARQRLDPGQAGGRRAW